MDSDEYSTDDTSRKRRALRDVEEGFERSKKTSRTPPKPQKNETDKWDQLLSLMKDLKCEQKEIKCEVQQIRKEQNIFKEEVLKLRQDNENLRKENKEIKNENKEIKEELKEMKSIIEEIEKDKKKNNIIINGIIAGSKDTLELKQETESLFNQHLDINTTVKAARRIAYKTILVEMENEKEKEKIMKNKAKLRNLKAERIYIKDDLTKNERKKQRWDKNNEELRKVTSRN